MCWPFVIIMLNRVRFKERKNWPVDLVSQVSLVSSIESLILLFGDNQSIKIIEHVRYQLIIFGLIIPPVQRLSLSLYKLSPTVFVSKQKKALISLIRETIPQLHSDHMWSLVLGSLMKRFDTKLCNLQ